MSPDATAVFARLIGAADNDVLDPGRIKRALLYNGRNDRRQHVIGPHAGERAGMAAERRA